MIIVNLHFYHHHHHSPGPHGNIFIAFVTKALTQNLKSLPRKTNFFFVSWTASAAHLGFGPYTVGHDLIFNSPHKAHAYNLIMEYPVSIQAIKYYS